MGTLEELSSIHVSRAMRSIGTPHPPITLSEGFVSSHPIAQLPPYSLHFRVPDTASVSHVTVSMDATSLPVTLALVSDLGVRGTLVSFLPGETHTLYPAASTVTGTPSIQVSSIDIARSTWKFRDRVKFKSFMYGALNTGGNRLDARTVFDRFARPVHATISSDTALIVANMEIDGSPLNITRYGIEHAPLPVHGTLTFAGGAATGKASVLAETQVEYIAPIANSFVADASKVERDALIETSLRVLGDLADSIERALEGSGRVSENVHQATYVENDQGYLRALAVATTSGVRPLVDAGAAGNFEVFPQVEGVDYINLPTNAMPISAPEINLLPSLEQFDLSAVQSLMFHTVPYSAFVYTTQVGVTITRSSPEMTIGDTVTIETDLPVSVRTPLGAGNAFVTTQELVAGTHTLFVAGYGLVPIEVISTHMHTDAFVFRGRKGLVVPPTVGVITSATTHIARLHAYHADLVPTGELRVRWLHQPPTVYSSIHFPLDASTTSVLARDETLEHSVERRLGVPLQRVEARSVSAPRPTAAQHVTCAFWLFVDADARLDTWRAPYKGGLVVGANTWFTASLSNTTLVITSDFNGAGEVNVQVPRDEWIFVCLRPLHQSIVVSHTAGYTERALNIPMNAATDMAIHALTGVHVKNLTLWDAHLDGATVRTLSDARTGPRMLYDFVDIPLVWLQAPVTQVGIDTRLLTEGAPASAFDVAHGSFVWYHYKPPPPSLTQLTYTGGLTTAIFSGTVVKGYAEGEGLVVLEVDQNRAVLSGNVNVVPPGSFLSSENVPVDS